MGLRRRSVPAGGIGCEPACVRAPLKSVSHPNWLTAAPPNGPPSTLSALSLADSRKTLALGLLLWDGTGTGRGGGTWYLGTWVGRSMTRGEAVAPAYSPRIKPLVATLTGDPSGEVTKWSFHVGMGETEAKFAVPIRLPAFSGAPEWWPGCVWSNLK